MVRFDRVRAEVAHHPGQRARLEWDRLQRMSDVAVRNFRELLAILEAPERDPDLALELIQNVRPPDVRAEYFGQLDQRLHNYLASAGALIDHVRRHVEGYKGTPFAREYARRKGVVTAAPVSDFMKRLRNYLLHYRLLFLAHNVSVKGTELAPGTVDVRVEVSTETLLQWDGWHGQSRSYLRQAGEAVDIRAALLEYGRLLDDLYQWMFQQFQQLHGSEIKDLNDLIDEGNRILAGED